MASNAANEQELGALHNITAKVLKQTLDVFDIAQKAYLATNGLQRQGDEEAGIEPLYADPPILAPAMLAAIIKFLKDNDITAAPEDSEELSGLAQSLAQKRARRKAPDVSTVPHTEDDEFQTVWTA